MQMTQMMSMHNTQQASEHDSTAVTTHSTQHNSAPSMTEMDCCDTEAAEFVFTSCCDGQCECSSAVSSLVMLTPSLSVFQLNVSSKPILYHSIHFPAAIVTQVKRPPIA
jgi:hypothetical protein